MSLNVAAAGAAKYPPCGGISLGAWVSVKKNRGLLGAVCASKKGVCAILLWYNGFMIILYEDVADVAAAALRIKNTINNALDVPPFGDFGKLHLPYLNAVYSELCCAICDYQFKGRSIIRLNNIIYRFNRVAGICREWLLWAIDVDYHFYLNYLFDDAHGLHNWMIGERELVPRTENQLFFPHIHPEKIKKQQK